MPNADKFSKYIEYIESHKNTTVAVFDTDWLPIGPRIRKDMLSAGLIFQAKGKIYLTSQTSPRK